MSKKLDALAKKKTEALRAYKEAGNRMSIHEIVLKCNVTKKIATEWAREFREQHPRQKPGDTLTEQERAMCEKYITCFSERQAAVSAGMRYEDARLALRRRDVQQYIKNLKMSNRRRAAIDTDDIINRWAAIAFADIGDYVYIDEHGMLRLKPDCDTSVLQEVTQSPQGTNIRLADRGRALDQLAKYLDVIPDWRERIAQRQLDAQLGESGGGEPVKIIDDIHGTGGEEDGTPTE